MSNYRELSAFFRQYKSKVTKRSMEVIRQGVYDIAQEAKRNLARNGNIDTGALYESVRGEVEYEAHAVRGVVLADARNEDGTAYAEFIEFGTGIYNEHGDGRKTPWRYKNRDGEWITTRGSHPYPFMRPAFAACKDKLNKDMQKAIRIDGEKL